MSSPTTIVALSSGQLPSGVAIIRLSGPKAFDAVRQLAGDLPRPRALGLRYLKHPQTQETLDHALVAVFPGPHSFTGEDCAELQVHGSPAGVKAIINALIALPGIALAAAGDFTRRAFENGKLDLTGIEGLGDMLAAETEGQRRQALARLEGGLSEKILLWRALLLDARAEIEAHLDFSDEDDVPFTLPDHFATDLEVLRAALSEALAGYERGRIVREGFRVVLAGAPNAGKSSLLNALAGSDLAIVTAEAGTTRDTRDVSIDLGGLLVTLTDTAGLRDTDSLAEGEGIKRAQRAMEQADLVVWLRAPDADLTPPITHVPLITVATKTDIQAPVVAYDVAVSTQSGNGLDGLISAIQSRMSDRIGADELGLVSHMRDKEALGAALQHVNQALGTMDRPELCAEELRGAADRLAGLIGLMDSEAVLDRLFAGFCIGK